MLEEVGPAIKDAHVLVRIYELPEDDEELVQKRKPRLFSFFYSYIPRKISFLQDFSEDCHLILDLSSENYSRN
jgi:hypothetical protein